ncbi:MAG: hypothetical protein ACE5GX_09140 [Thermoanaerobaculia bacterium]
MVELSDWIWLGVAVIWVVTRVLPRLFRKQVPPAAAQSRRRPKAAPGSTATQGPIPRPDPARQLASQQPDAQTLRRIRSAEPIEPR